LGRFGTPFFKKGFKKKENAVSRFEARAAQGAPSLKKPRELLKKLDQNFSENDLFLSI